MAKKNLYIRDEDEELWKRAEELVKGTQTRSLSSLIPRLLEKEIEKMEAQEEVLEDASRIVVDIGMQWDMEDWAEERKPMRCVAFEGKWIAKDYYAKDGGCYSVALTKKRQLFVAIAAGKDVLPFGYWVYATFQMMAEDTGTGAREEYWPFPYPDNLLSLVASVMGEVHIEELDI